MKKFLMVILLILANSIGIYAQEKCYKYAKVQSEFNADREEHWMNVYTDTFLVNCYHSDLMVRLEFIDKVRKEYPDWVFQLKKISIGMVVEGSEEEVDKKRLVEIHDLEKEEALVKVLSLKEEMKLKYE